MVQPIVYTIKKGLDIPISGRPLQSVEQADPVRRVALLGPDYQGMKPSMAVKVGDRVKIGQKLFEDKKTPGVVFTSPAGGEVEAINRGERRLFLSLVIRVDGDEHLEFSHYSGKKITSLSDDEIRDLLVESGLWTAFRTRPFSKVPAPDSTPHSIFVTAIDSNPLAPDVDTVLEGHTHQFTLGLKALRRLTEGRVFLCKSPGKTNLSRLDDTVTVAEFAGPHPAGLPGTHIHFLDPVGLKKCVWHIGYQDVVAIGHLFETGRLLLGRVVSSAGPQVDRPRLLRTRLGANLDDLTKGELRPGKNRLISGSVLSGRKAEGPVAYLGRYHQQITAIREDSEQELFGWLAPGGDKFSLKNVFVSKLFGRENFSFTSSQHGNWRPIVPIGSFERVMPLDIEPTFLARAIAVGDTEAAQVLGCLELDEEDLALMTFVDSSKNDFGPMLRETLTQIEKEG